LRHVGGEQVVKAAIFADDNDHMLDRRRCLDGLNGVLCANTLRERKGRKRNAEQAKPARQRCF
jgi:hypothetical protein